MYRILIADDEKVERDVIIFLLNKYDIGFDIFQASNGRDAMAILADKPVDILLTDIKMPFSNGMELASKARNLNPDIEILFFSGYGDFEYVKTALSLHAVNYILKPVNPEEFKKSIFDILNAINAKETANTERYIEERFLIKSRNNEIYKDPDFDIQDSLLLGNIEHAIRLNDAQSVKQNVSILLEKHKYNSSNSSIYIRHLYITLLRILLNVFPHLDKNDFKQVVDEFYALRDSSDIHGFMEEFLDNVFSQMREKAQSPKYVVYLVKEYIHTYYNEDLNLELLAKKVFISPKYLSNMFIQATGIGINKYIKKVRMEKAQELLLTTNMKIIDICRSVGYDNESYFCRVFQTTFGLTPDKYRQNGGKIECNV